MALVKTNISNIPSDAILLSEEDAISYQLKIIQNWKKSSDTWPIKYGYSILASMSAISAFYINNHYRVKYRLHNFGRISSYIPVVILPSIVTSIYHQQFIVTDIMLQKSCPICVEVRAAAFQTVLGTVFPAILAPLAALPFAIRYNTYNVPLITTEPKKVFQMWYRHTRPIGNILIGMMAVHGFVAAFLTYQESKSFFKIQSKLFELEQKLELEHSNVV